MVHALSRFKYGGWRHAGGLLMLEDTSSWRWSVTMPWLVYVVVSVLLYAVSDSDVGGLLALCAVVTFVTIVATNGHRISDVNRSLCPRSCFTFLLCHRSSSTDVVDVCLLYTSPSPRDRQKSRMPSSA